MHQTEEQHLKTKPVTEIIWETQNWHKCFMFFDGEKLWGPISSLSGSGYFIFLSLCQVTWDRLEYSITEGFLEQNCPVTHQPYVTVSI